MTKKKKAKKDLDPDGKKAEEWYEFEEIKIKPKPKKDE